MGNKPERMAKQKLKKVSKNQENACKILPKPSQNGPKTIKIHEKSFPGARPGKNHAKVRKSDPWDFSWVSPGE